MTKSQGDGLDTLPGTDALSATMLKMSQTAPKYAKSEYWPLTKLSLWDKNPRSIKSDRFNELKTRLTRQGQIKPLLVTKQGTVIGGNMRLRAMQELGYNEVWVSVTNAETDKDIFDLALTDNEEFGYYEQEQLAELAMDIGLSPLELQAYEVTLGEPITLTSLIDQFGPEDEVEEDETPEVDDTETFSEAGQVYQLGRHRLMCGSATEHADLSVLLDNTEVALVNTDPPYGIGVVGGNGKIGGDNLAKNGLYAPVANDDSTDTARDSYELLKALGIEHYVIWGGNYFTDFLPPSPSWLVWDKRGDMASNNFADCELAWSSFTTPARVYKQIWSGMIKEGESGKRVHPTQKPVNMLARVIKDFSERDEVILDVFGGSGSVLMAAEETGRICYMMELSPAYCDVIRKRYANHIGEGESWQAATPAIS